MDIHVEFGVMVKMSRLHVKIHLSKRIACFLNGNKQTHEQD